MHIILTEASPSASLFELDSMKSNFRIDLTCALKINILLSIHFKLVAVIDVYEEHPQLSRFPSLRLLPGCANVFLSGVSQSFKNHKTIKRRYYYANVISLFFKNITVS